MVLVTLAYVPKGTGLGARLPAQPRGCLEMSITERSCNGRVSEMHLRDCMFIEATHAEVITTCLAFSRDIRVGVLKSIRWKMSGWSSPFIPSHSAVSPAVLESSVFLFGDLTGDRV